MKHLLIRFWRWLGRALGVESTSTVAPPTAVPPQQAQPPGGVPGPADESGVAGLPAAAAPPVTLPPPHPQPFDLSAQEGPRFGRKGSVLTKRELTLYHHLLPATGADYTVLSKVRLWDIVWLTNEPPERKQHLNRLSCRHVDFLLCDPDTLRPRLAIELDDRTHENAYAQADDQYKNELFAAAGLPLLRLDQPNLTARILRQRIEAALAA